MTSNNHSLQKTGLPPRRTLNRLALALVAIATSILAQTFFSQGLLWDGVLFYGVAIILFSRALADRLHPNSQRSTLNVQLPPSLALHGGWRRNVGIWLIMSAVGISFLAFNFFASPRDCFACEDARPQAWWLYLVSLALLVSGGVLLTKSNSWRMELQSLLPNRPIVLALMAVMGLALFMRLYNFGNQPFGIWFDEAEAGLQARQMWQEPTYRPVFYARINITGHLLAVYTLALAWLGDTVYSMRLVSVLFGLGGVLAAYLFGRELRGPRFGLALAFFVAIARWHVNFSRIAMTGIDTPFFEFLGLFFLVRLLRRGRLRDALWAGLTLGFGLVFYTAFRLYVLALLIFAIISGILWATRSLQLRRSQTLKRETRWRWSYLASFSLLLVSTWLVIMPVAKFALANSESFWYRTRQISIFSRRDQPDLGQALWQNTGKHLLMFNFKGDDNGRHNLPGEPMLDPAMGILAVLGFGLVLARPYDPANAFFLVLFPTALIGGILSVDFEAPQSLRTIAVMPAVIYFAGLALAALGREAEEVLSVWSRIWLIGPVVILGSFMLLYNAFIYFNRQAHDFASWNAFSTPETITAHKMTELGPNYIYYLSPLFINHPTIDFLVPNITDQRALLLSDPLPIREPPDHPVALFIHPDDVWLFKEAQRLYPQAEFQIINHTAGIYESPIVYFVHLQPTDLAAGQGLELNYYRRSKVVDKRSSNSSGAQPGKAIDEPAGSLVDMHDGLSLQSSRALNINLTWPDDNPLAINETSLMPGNLVAEWQGILYVPDYGPYSFRLMTPGSGRLELDGNPIFAGQGEQLTGLSLAQGNHTLRVQAEVTPGEVALYWQPPGQGEVLIPQWALYAPPITNHGLQGSFYPNDRWEGQPAFQRIDTFLDTHLHLPPLDRPYTVEWTGLLDVPQSGIYRLGLRAVPEAQLFLAGQRRVATTAPDQYTETAIHLPAGLHDIRVRFKDDTDRSHIHLFWTPPDGQLEPIPTRYLWPPLGRYPHRSPLAAQTRVTSLQLKWLATSGGPGSDPGQFFEPRDVVVLPNGYLVVADTMNRRVQILDSQGNPGRVLTGDEHPFQEPLAVGINSRAEILILDSSQQWIYRYDSAGNFIDRFGGPTAYLFHPRGMTVFEDDTIALADTGNGRLAFFSADGIQAGSMGGLGTGPGQFNEPTDVLRNAQGVYFVAEAMNNRVQLVDFDGTPLNEWTIPPAYALNGPHLAFARDGSIFLTESQSRSLLHYAPDGSLLNRWESIGPVSLAAPVGVYFDTSTSRLYVTDIWTHQVHVFEVQVQS